MPHIKYLSLLGLLLSFLLGGQKNYAATQELKLIIINDDEFDIIDPKIKAIMNTCNEIVRRTLEYMGYKAVFERYNGKRVYATAKNPTSFGTFPWIKIPDRAVNFYYSRRPFYSYRLEALVLKTSSLEKLDKTKIKGMTTCDGLGSRVYRDLPLSVSFVRKQSQCIKMLRTGRVQFIMYPEPYKNNLGPDFKVIPNDLDIYTTTYLLVNKAYPGAKRLMDAYDKAFAVLEEQGVLQSIAASFGIPVDEYKVLTRPPRLGLRETD